MKVINFSNSIMTKKLLQSVATITLVMTLWAQTAIAAFPDVPNTHKNYLAVEYLNQNGIVSGYEDGTFKPQQLVNRVEALKIILEGNEVGIKEDFGDIPFSDVGASDWFTKYVMSARDLGIVEGNPDGTFAPGRDVVRAEFLKMLLNTNNFKTEKWEGAQIFSDVPADQWYTPYMNYAGQAGLVTKDADNNLYPAQALDRGQVAEIMYLLRIILNGGNTQFLISEAEKQMAQIDIYVGDNQPLLAKRAAELAVDMTQQAYKNMPEDNIVVGAAKIARAYDFVMNAYISAIQQNWTEAEDWANQAITKATEAWEVNNELQPIAAHIKDRANEVLAQIPSE